MAFVPIPKDLSKVKSKVLFNLTKRQLICFGLGALIGLPIFFLLKPYVSISTAAFCMILVMLPFFLFAMYEQNGLPLEQVLDNVIEMRFRRPKFRPYQTNNYYALLEKQAQLNKEVEAIVKKKRSTKAQPRRPKGNRSRRSRGARRR